MTRFLSHPDQSVLLANLANAGFVFESPEPFQVVHHEGNDAIYLGHIPAQYDEEGNIIRPESTDFCANVTSCEGHVFETECFPKNPYNKFAE